jgi:hypothetical protein
MLKKEKSEKIELKNVKIELPKKPEPKKEEKKSELIAEQIRKENERKIQEMREREAKIEEEFEDELEEILDDFEIPNFSPLSARRQPARVSVSSENLEESLSGVVVPKSEKSEENPYSSSSKLYSGVSEKSSNNLGYESNNSPSYSSQQMGFQNIDPTTGRDLGNQRRTGFEPQEIGMVKQESNFRENYVMSSESFDNVNTGTMNRDRKPRLF